MQTNRWQKIERIFNEALSLSPEERNEFLARACGEDAALREELEALFAEDAKTDGVLNQPVFTFGIQLFNEDFENLLETPDFERYKLHKLLGRGGMGAVFLAEDTKLERLAALKILPTALGERMDESLLRFQQEARAASAITHPNVAHIYEFGSFENRYFLAMEYVEGQTLRRRLKEKPLDAPASLDIAAQVAAALRAAHKRGIVHRDIKPENIMLADEGLVKVLDFGLAKITESQNRLASGNYRRTSSLDTAPGLIIGTTAYMSPEQIRGQTLDARTDLWSLGICLYEMLAGKRPFDGDTPNDVQAAILKDEPAFPETSFPADLKTVLQKALKKEKAERYQTADEFLHDLKLLRRQFGQIELPSEAALHATEAPPVLRNSSADSAASSSDEGKKNDFTPRVILAAILLFVVAAFGGGWLLVRRLNGLKKTMPPQNFVRRIDKLTNSGRAIIAAFSPDGEKLAYVLEEAGGRGIYLRRRNSASVFSAEVTTVVPPAHVKLHGLAFMPDGEHLYFRQRKDNEATSSFYRVSIAGGEPQKIISDVYGAPSFSPDGRQFVFLRLSRDNSREDLIIADANGKNQRILYTRRRPEFIPDEARPSWSPDGQTIVCAAGIYINEREQVLPMAIRVSDGAATPVFNEPWEQIWATEWLGNGKAFVMTGRQDRVHENNPIWRVEYPSGAVTRLTNDYNDYYTISAPRLVNPANNQLVSLILQRTAHLWRAELARPAETAVQLTGGEGDNGFGVSWRQPGKIIYGAMTAGNADIWAMDEAGANRRQLTASEYLDSQPAITADGRFIIFGSERSGAESLWKINSDGGEPALLAPNAYRDSVAVTPDGKYVYYRSDVPDGNALWRVGIENPQPEKIAAGNYRSIAISPDGRFLAATLSADNADGKDLLALMTIDNLAKPVRVFSLAEGAMIEEKIRFSPDGKSIVYIVTKKGVGNLHAQPIDGSASRNLTKFNNNRLYSFDWSPDGRQFVCARGDLNGSVTLLTLDAGS